MLSECWMPDVQTCVVLVAGSVNVSQHAAHGVEDGLGGAGVPLLAALRKVTR